MEEHPLAARPTSINKILRANPRERLLEVPELWTSRHLELLGCQFCDHNKAHRAFKTQGSQAEQPAFDPCLLPPDPNAAYYLQRFETRHDRWMYLLAILLGNASLFKLDEYDKTLCGS